MLKYRRRAALEYFKLKCQSNKLPCITFYRNASTIKKCDLLISYLSAFQDISFVPNSNKHGKRNYNMQIFIHKTLPSILRVRSFPVPTIATLKRIRPLRSVWSAPQSFGINFSHLLCAFIWQPIKEKRKIGEILCLTVPFILDWLKFAQTQTKRTFSFLKFIINNK